MDSYQYRKRQKSRKGNGNSLSPLFRDINHIFCLVAVMFLVDNPPHLCDNLLNVNKMSTTTVSNEMEFNRFGWISMTLLVVGCLGGVTVGMGAIENTLALIAVVIPTMITLSLLLAVSPMKYILTGAAVSVAIDLILISYYLVA